MKHFLPRSTHLGDNPPSISRPSGALMLLASVGLAQPASAALPDEVGPGSMAYFDSAESWSEAHSPDCDVNLCGTAPGTSKTGSYAISIGTTTQRARQTSVLVKPFKVPESDLGYPPENTVLDARVTGSVKWRGTLWSLDFATLGMVSIPAMGPTADAFIRVSLVDVTNPDEPFDVGNEAIADFHCDPVDRELGAEIPIPLVSDGVELEIKAGWCEEHSEDTFSFGAKVIQGHEYELQLSMICQAITGATPTLLSACSFNSSPIAYDLRSEMESALDDLSNSNLKIKTPAVDIVLPDISVPIDIDELNIHFSVDVEVPDIHIPGTTIDFSVPLKGAVSPILTSIIDAIVPSIDNGYLEWDYMTVTIDPDITGLLRSTKNEILGEVGLVRDDLEVVRKGVGESIKLLNTPQGRRQTTSLYGYPDLCGDGDCAWGETH